MSGFLTNITTWLSLCLIPIVIGQILLYQYRQRVLKKFSSLPDLVCHRSTPLYALKQGNWILIWLLLIVSYLASPSWHASLSHRAQPLQHLIVLVDASASMGAKDGGEGRSRLEAAQNILEQLIPHLKGSWVSLNAFTSILTPLVPPTWDYFFLLLQTRLLHLNEGEKGGTEFLPAFQAMNRQLSFLPSLPTTILLLSDGEQMGETIPPQEIWNALSLPIQKQTRLITIGLGAAQPAPVPTHPHVVSAQNPEFLQKLAGLGKGSYMNGSSNKDDMIRNILQNIAAKNEDLPLETTLPPPSLFLTIALFLYLINLFFPDTLKT